MGVGDPSLKSRVHADDAIVAAVTARPPVAALGSDRPHRDLKSSEHRPTCKLHRDELLGLAHESTLPTADEILVLDQENRRTTQMSPRHFQLLARVHESHLQLSAEDIVRMGEAEVEALLALDVAAATVAVPAPIVDRSTEQHEPEQHEALPPPRSDVALLVTACVGLLAVVLTYAAIALF